MQETTYADGTITRELFGALPGLEAEMNLRQKMLEEYLKASGNRDVTEIRQVKNCMRNQLCPCGSGKKFKKCCLSLVNKGPQFVQH